MHLAEAGERPLGERVDVARLRHVGRDREHRVAGSGELALGRRQRRRLDVGDDDLHALGREAIDHAAADSARPAGHDGDLVS